MFESGQVQAQSRRRDADLDSVQQSVFADHVGNERIKCAQGHRVLAFDVAGLVGDLYGRDSVQAKQPSFRDAAYGLGVDEENCVVLDVGDIRVERYLRQRDEHIGLADVRVVDVAI